jgi:hypothetical protein
LRYRLADDGGGPDWTAPPASTPDEQPRMTIEEFTAATAGDTPPAGLSPVLLALWHDARNDWSAAHEVAQDVPDPDGAWVHAYLHRKEGDAGNAAYWYRRAARPVCTGDLRSEWSQLVSAFLARGT